MTIKNSSKLKEKISCETHRHGHVSVRGTVAAVQLSCMASVYKPGDFGPLSLGNASTCNIMSFLTVASL